MDAQDYYFRRTHVPAFGSWDCNEDLPFTQCFESARQAGLLRYSYSDQDRDLYVAGDLYENDVVTPAMIVVPRHRVKASYPQGKGGKGESAWVVCDCECAVKQPPSPPPPSPPRRVAKAVDEDLYKISPELLHAKPRRVHSFKVNVTPNLFKNGQKLRQNLVDPHVTIINSESYTLGSRTGIS